MKKQIILSIAVVAFNLLIKQAFSQSISDLESQVSRFQSDSRDIYRLDDDAKQAIWEAYCGKLDPESESDIKFATEIGYNYQQKEQDQVHNLLDQANSLIEKLDNFRNDPENSDKAENLLEIVQRETDNLHKLDDGIVLKGSNSPFVQYAIDYGKKMHQEMCNQYGEQPKICDKNFSGLNGRPDLVFIDGDGLWIYEFKPNNSEAISNGESQVRGYQDGVERYFQYFFPNGRSGSFKSGDSEHGGNAFLQKLKDCPKCWTSDGSHIEARTKVVTYSPCEKRFNY